MFSANPYVEPVPGTPQYERECFEPIVTLHETPTSYAIELELPEAAASDIDVRAFPHDVVIRCRHARDHLGDAPRFGRFLKRVHLAHAIDPRRAQTVFADGVLEIAITKRNPQTTT